MIRVTIVLESAINPARSRKLGEIEISNSGEHYREEPRHNYNVKFINKNNRVFNRGRIENWPRNAKSIWKLLQAVMNIAYEGVKDDNGEQVFPHPVKPGDSIYPKRKARLKRNTT